MKQPRLLTELSDSSIHSVPPNDLIQLKFSPDVTARLVELSQGRLEIALLAALAMVIQQRLAGDSFTVDLESHGRDASGLGLNLDVSRTVGCCWLRLSAPSLR